MGACCSGVQPAKPAEAPKAQGRPPQEPPRPKRRFSGIRPAQVSSLPLALTSKFTLDDPPKQGSYADVFRAKSKSDSERVVAVRAFSLRRMDVSILKDFALVRHCAQICMKEGQDSTLQDGIPRSRRVSRPKALTLDLKHRNIVTMQAVAANVYYFCIVCDYLEGPTLSTCVYDTDDFRLSEDQARWAFAHILSVVCHLHSRGIIHRALQSSNFMFARAIDAFPAWESVPVNFRDESLFDPSKSASMSRSARKSVRESGLGGGSSQLHNGSPQLHGVPMLMLIDFTDAVQLPFATDVGVQGEHGRPHTVSFSDKPSSFATTFSEGSAKNPNDLVGSRFIQSPEVIASRSWSLASDVWALGVMLYEMLHGAMPFFGHNKTAVDKAIQSAGFDVDSNVSLAANSLIVKLLDKSAAARPTVNEIWTHEWMCLVEPVAPSSAASSLEFAVGDLRPGYTEHGDQLIATSGNDKRGLLEQLTGEQSIREASEETKNRSNEIGSEHKETKKSDDSAGQGDTGKFHRGNTTTSL